MLEGYGKDNMQVFLLLYRNTVNCKPVINVLTKSMDCKSVKYRPATQGQRVWLKSLFARLQECLGIPPTVAPLRSSKMCKVTFIGSDK